MKRKFLWMLLGNLFVGAFATIGAEQEVKTEGRAIWVTRFDYKSPEDVKKIISNVARYGFNQILFQVRGNGTVFYKSKIEPWAFELTSNSPETTGEDPGWDPLQTAIDAAHTTGVQIHAYMNVFPAWRTQKFPPKNVKQLWWTHPDWFMVWKGGKKMLPPDKEKGSKWGDWYSFISPGIPAVQDYLVSVFKEVVTNYDVDGIHFDYIRYPSEIGDFSYDKVSLERFKRKYGHTPDELPAQWVKWRSDQVTAIERRIYYECTAIRPNLVVSAATVRKYEKARSRYYQRSFDWMEEGTLDVAIPMQYTTDDEEFRVCAEDYVKHSYGHMVYPGIGVHRLKTPKHLIRQIDISREVGCKGIGFFAYKSFFPNHKPNKFAEALKKGPFTERALPPQMPWKNPNPKLTPTRRTELKIP